MKNLLGDKKYRIRMQFTGERFIPGLPGKNQKNEAILRYEFACRYAEGKMVLDVACGSGYGSRMLAGLASSVVGVDNSKAAIDYAQKHYGKENIRFFEGDAADLGFLKTGFDVIVSFETIEHIRDINGYLKEMLRLLKPNGVFVISTPNKKYSSPNSEKPENPFHVTEFYANGFEELLKKYFSSVKMVGQDYQSASKKVKWLILKIVPVRLLEALIPAKIREPYSVKQVEIVEHKKLEECRGLIGICRK